MPGENSRDTLASRILIDEVNGNVEALNMEIEHTKKEPLEVQDPAEREVCPVCGSEVSGPCFCKNCGHRDCGG
jgi:hypothetical protein